MIKEKINELNIQAVIDTQIKQFYFVIGQERDNRVKVRNWAITIWLAYLTILGSGKIQVNNPSALFTLVMIIVIFWVVEAFHQSLVIINENRVKKLEELISRSSLPKSVPLDLFYESGYNTIKQKEKIKAFLLACFTSEPIVFFNLAMVFGSFLFIYLVGTLPQPIQESCCPQK